jgi:glycosyltransferase involved in cell wall biosynthesis
MLPSRYANSVHVTNMAAGLAQSGAEVTLFAFKGDGSLLPSAGDDAVFDFYGLEPSFRIVWLPQPLPRGVSLISSISVWFTISGFAPDLVIGRHGKACLAAALRGVPTVYETHRPLAWQAPVDRFLVRRLLRLRAFRGLVTISNPLRDILAEETGLPASRILVAHDAAPPPSAIEPASFAQGDRLQIGYVGGFYPGRGIELVLDVAASLPEMDFHLIGGTATDLEQWHADVPDLANVRFHGFQAPAHAAAMRAGCDVLMAPYQHKTLIKDGWDTTRWMSPLKIFEYMASAKPILCSDLPVLREVMTDDRNAVLLAPDDRSAWVAALRRLQADPAYARALGEQAFEDFMHNHTWEQRARRIIAFAGESQ